MPPFAFAAVLVAFLRLASGTSAPPLSDCYALDKGNFLHDFTDKVGRQLELEEKGSDFVLRFCVDIQNRSNNGYVNFGRFSPQRMVKNEMDNFDFFQEYKYGDLVHCEHIGNDFQGREAEVKFICGTCPNGATCKDDFGCICNVTYTHNLCKVGVLAALNCTKQGSHIFPELSIGMQPKGCEVVKEGITQKQYRMSLHTHSFESSQRTLFLYVTSTAGFPGNLQKPDLKASVQPSQGLVVSVVSRPLGIVSTTEATTLLEVDWKCEKVTEQSYEVKITIPIEGYDPVEFFLRKQCRTLDTLKGAESTSIIMLEVVSLIVLAGSTIFGITYYCNWKKQSKSDNGPTMPLLNDNLDHVDGREDICQASIEVPLV